MHPHEASIYNVILVAFICIGSIILYFLATLIFQQKKYRSIYTDRVSSEIEQLELERKEIAGELHDDFGPILFATRMNLAALKPGNDKDVERQKEALAQLDLLTNKLRTFTRELIPSGLFVSGLLPALKEFFKNINSNYTLELSFNVQDLPYFSEAKTIHIYRIIQEIMFNTIKHADATCLTVEMYIVKDNFAIATADDGNGFDHKAKLITPKGQGLKNIFNRVELLNGEVHIDSVRKKGTSYYISIPLKD